MKTNYVLIDYEGVPDVAGNPVKLPGVAGPLVAARRAWRARATDV